MLATNRTRSISHLVLSGDEIDPRWTESSRRREAGVNGQDEARDWPATDDGLDAATKGSGMAVSRFRHLLGSDGAHPTWR